MKKKKKSKKSQGQQYREAKNPTQIPKTRARKLIGMRSKSTYA